MKIVPNTALGKVRFGSFASAAKQHTSSYPTYPKKHDVAPLNDDVYLDKLQTRGVKKSILYM